MTIFLALSLFAFLLLIGWVILRAPSERIRTRIHVISLYGSPESTEYQLREYLARIDHRSGGGSYRLLVLHRGNDAESLQICRILKRRYPFLILHSVPNHHRADSCEKEQNAVY